jgi:hypothetical protein
MCLLPNRHRIIAITAVREGFDEERVRKMSPWQIKTP